MWAAHPATGVRALATRADVSIGDEVVMVFPNKVIALGRGRPRRPYDRGMLQRYDERNADLHYWVNGVLRHRNEPGISPFDSVVQGGDAVWEGLRLYDGKIFGLGEHLARLRRSAAALGFVGVPSDDEVLAAVRATLLANAMRD